MLDPRTHQPANALQLFDENTNRNRARHSSYYTTWEATNSGFWPSKTGTESKEEETGMCSPPLWRTSPPASPHHGGNNHYRSLSPASRTQAIVKGQRELMDMVKNMPESNYELSLKDLVEHHRVQQRQQQENVVVDERKLKGSGSRKVKRSGSIDRGSGGGSGGGFYIKMGLRLPLTFGGSKNKKKNNNKNKNKKDELSANNNGCSSKVSPRPSTASDGSVKVGVDKEWWKKSPNSVSKESDSGVSSSANSRSSKSSGSSSSDSTSSTSNSRNEKSGGHCWPFIRKPKKQTRK